MRTDDSKVKSFELHLVGEGSAREEERMAPSCPFFRNMSVLESLDQLLDASQPHHEHTGRRDWSSMTTGPANSDSLLPF